MNQVQLDPFLENWKRVMATAHTIMKMVRVIKGVATVTNGKVFLRCPAGEVEDGFYKMIGTDNRLIPITEFDHDRLWSRREQYWGSPQLFFPDVEQFNPRFEMLKPFCALDKKLIQNMMAISEHVRKVDGQLLMGDNYLTMQQRPHGDLTLTYNFSVPNGDEYVINPEELKLALIEMLRYDQVYLARKESDSPQPLIIGLNWNRCALLAVEKRSRDRQDGLNGQYLR